MSEQNQPDRSDAETRAVNLDALRAQANKGGSGPSMPPPSGNPQSGPSPYDTPTQGQWQGGSQNNPQGQWQGGPSQPASPGAQYSQSAPPSSAQNGGFAGGQYPGAYGAGQMTGGPGQYDPGQYNSGQYGPGPYGGRHDYASWGSRALGYLIDALLTLPAVILYLLAFTMAKKSATDANGTKTASVHFSGASLVLLLLGMLLAVAIQVWNRWYKGGKTGQTVGRKVAGVKVVDEGTGQPIGPLMAFVRDIAHILDSIICGLPIGWLSPLWDSKRQTWADKVIKTVAVNAPKN